MDKERDKAALASLDDSRKKTGASYNEIILERILAGDRNDTAVSEKSGKADYIAELVTERLKDILERQFGHPSYITVESADEMDHHDIPDADAPQNIDDNALSFLSSFGI